MTDSGILLGGPRELGAILADPQLLCHVGQTRSAASTKHIANARHFQTILAQQLHANENLLPWREGRLCLGDLAVEGKIHQVDVLLESLATCQQTRGVADKTY